jgi:hypothetical protein
MSAAKRPTRTQQEPQRAAGKPATAAQSPRGARKPASSAKPRPRVPAKTGEAQRSQERLQEHRALLHDSLAAGASAMAKAIKNAHKLAKRRKAS